MEKKLSDLTGWALGLALAGVPLLNYVGVVITEEIIQSVSANVNEWMLTGGALVVGFKAWARRTKDLV